MRFYPEFIHDVHTLQQVDPVRRENDCVKMHWEGAKFSKLPFCKAVAGKFSSLSKEHIVDGATFNMLLEANRQGCCKICAQLFEEA